MTFVRALPVLPVRDLAAEVAFYESLGFAATHPEDGFVSLEYDGVLFGLRRVGTPVPPDGLAWQLEVTDVHVLHDLVRAQGVVVVEEPRRQPWGEWTLRVRTPNDYVLVLEGGGATAELADVRGLALSLPEVVELRDDDGLTYRRAHGPVLARVRGERVEVTGPEGQDSLDLRTVSAASLEEALRTSWELNGPPPADVGPMRTE